MGAYDLCETLNVFFYSILYLFIQSGNLYRTAEYGKEQENAINLSHVVFVPLLN